MKNYCAKIVAEKVDEIIVADLAWADNNLQGNWVDCKPDKGELVVGCGWSYDFQTNTFAPPASIT